MTDEINQPVKADETNCSDPPPDRTFHLSFLPGDCYLTTTFIDKSCDGKKDAFESVQTPLDSQHPEASPTFLPRTLTHQHQHHHHHHQQQHGVEDEADQRMMMHRRRRHCHCRLPNQLLSVEEKEGKRQLKKLLKQQTRIRKYQTRLRQAQQRQDDVCAQQSQEQLNQLLRLQQLQLQQKQQSSEHSGGETETVVPDSTLKSCCSRTDTNAAAAAGGGGGGGGGSRYVGESVARDFIESIYHQLQKQLHIHLDQPCQKRIQEQQQQQQQQKPQQVSLSAASTAREFCNEQARILLQNMMRGTQTREMFHNVAALRGYTRQKFIERSTLVVQAMGNLLVQTTNGMVEEKVESNQKNGQSSLSLDRKDGNDDHRRCSSSPPVATAKLTGFKDADYNRSPTDAFSAMDSTDTTTADTASVRWLEKIKAIRSICSIGCGPGCDAIGVMGLLHSIKMLPKKQQGQQPLSSATTTHQREALVQRIVLLDWAIEQWNPILESLQHVLQQVKKRTTIKNGYPEETHPTHDTTRSSLLRDPTCLQTGFCDVRSSLWSPEHAETRELLAFSHGIQESVPHPSSESSLSFDVDIYVISYLLSETRGKWQVFFDDLIPQTSPGTLFLLSDPTAWQLHEFIDRYDSCSKSSSVSSSTTPPLAPFPQEAGEQQNPQQQHCPWKRKFVWQWLDSSMHRPELQPLEGRVGPAVVLGMTI